MFYMRFLNAKCKEMIVQIKREIMESVACKNDLCKNEENGKTEQNL